MILLVLLLIFPTLDTHTNSLTLVKSLGQVVDTNELEWASIVGKINNNTSKIIRSGSRYKWVRVRDKSGED
jgi:hypothetical protein